MNQSHRHQTESHDSWLRSYLDQDPGLAIIHTNPTIHYVNPVGVRLLGATAIRELIGRSLYDFILQNDQATLQEDIEKLLQTGKQELSVRRSMIRPDGTMVSLELFSRKITYQDQPAILITGRDVTAQLAAEEQKSRSEEKYRLLVENAGVAIFSVDQEGSLLMINEEGGRLFNRHPAELIGRTLWDLFPKRIADLQMRAMRRALRSKKHTVTEGPAEIQGVPKWFIINLHPVPDENGNYTIIQGTAHDITERKQAEEALHLTTERLSILHEIMTAALVTTLDLDQLLDLILEQLSHVLQYDSATIFLWEEVALRGMVCRGIESPESVIGQLFPAKNALFQYVLSRREPVYLADAGEDNRFMGWGGTARIRGWMGVPLIAHGKFIGYMTIDSKEKSAYNAEHVALVKPLAAQAAQAIRNARLYDQVQHDAAELEATLAKLQETQQQLVQQERLAAVGQLAAGIAHDFNNILAVIVLYAQLLQRTSHLSMHDHKRLQTIVEQGDRATQLIQQILDFSRKSIIERRPLFLPPFLKGLEKLLVRILPETIQLTVRIEEGHLEIQGDPTSLQQLLMNLAVNARDAMPDGGELQFIVAKLDLLSRDMLPFPELHHGKWVVIRVQDNGVGMEPDVRKKVFEPFFTTKPPGQGTGLGLAQAYGIVRQHDGYISCTSVAGEGTEFFIYLPASVSEPFNNKTADDTIQKGSGERVLVVEDNVSALTVIQEILELLNYQVVTASNGQEALDLLQSRSDIAVVLSDVVMPEMGGYALFKAIGEQYSHLKIILMSGYAKPLEKSSWAELQNVAWMRKPFSIDDLAGAVFKALKG